MRHSRPVSTRSLRLSIAAVAAGAILGVASGAALGAPGQAPSGPGGDKVSGNSGKERGGGNGRGNGGNGRGNGGDGGERGETNPNPITTPPAAPATPVAPPVSRPPSGGAPSSGSGNSGGGSTGGGSTRAPSPLTGGASSGGTGTSSGSRPSGGSSPSGSGASSGSGDGRGAAAAPAVPKGLPVRGLSAGSGPVSVAIYMDLGDASDASTYLSITTGLLRRVASDNSATVTFNPVIVGRDANSMEAALAVLAGANQNRTWCVTAQVATLRSTRGGDWINGTALRSIARSCGLSSSRFVREATGNRLYPRLNDIRAQARGDGVGTTPSYVVKGGGGSQVVVNPGSVDVVASAIAGRS